MFSIPFAARMFLTRWWPALLAGVVIIGGIAFIYVNGLNAGKNAVLSAQSEREADVQVNVSAANENASDARVVDAVEEVEQAQELKDAEQKVENLDDLRIKRGCVILRQQGRDTSKIPACR